MKHLMKTRTDEGVEAFRSRPGAVLLDVRDEDEYKEGHIPGSVNLPLYSLSDAAEQLPDLTTDIFVYCLSGARSAQAALLLEEMGYTHVTDIGGIGSYHGEIETGDAK